MSHRIDIAIIYLLLLLMTIPVLIFSYRLSSAVKHSLEANTVIQTEISDESEDDIVEDTIITYTDETNNN